MTTLILVRHGHVEGIEPSRFRGRADLALTSLGMREAKLTRDRIIASWTPDALYSSPLRRCVSTGEVIAGGLTLSVKEMSAFSDIDYGDWQGLTPHEVARHWPKQLALWYSAPQLVELPKGESLQDVVARTVRALHNALSACEGGTFVLVGHDSVNRILLLHALNMPLSSYWSLAQSPGAINVIDFDDEKFIVHTMNDAGHLAGG